MGYDGAGPVLIETGCVVFSGNRIEFVGRSFQGSFDREIDAGEALIAPGFVDLDALFDLDTTVLGFNNQPGWKREPARPGALPLEVSPHIATYAATDRSVTPGARRYLRIFAVLHR